jgi:hypothetical protein
VDSRSLTVGMNRNFKTQFESQLGRTLMEKEEQAFWEAINPASTKEQVQRASERLYDPLKTRGVKVQD